MEGHFLCVHTISFSEPTKIGSLKTDHVNGTSDDLSKNHFQQLT